MFLSFLCSVDKRAFCGQGLYILFSSPFDFFWLNRYPDSEYEYRISDTGRRHRGGERMNGEWIFVVVGFGERVRRWSDEAFGAKLLVERYIAMEGSD